ncbi:hypothetical protein [Thiovibrio frasassiensis]|uniref:Uncharacterized protein n=1 Tax=Thiovibrio frasassiensis TaxID=2984131 RepID=A0A9X4MI34_9BACT|nr:hypothetical protein [Thiovibrio frasassiensis]MDG4475264.1 hypothetical protein [Thiovibrio frasassiensis]
MTITTFDKNMSAVAFAEAGEHDTARQILGANATKQAGKSTAPAAKGKPYLKTIIFGAISLSAYYFLFTNEQLVTDTFTMGGWHWVYPVGAAFFFSFTHGAFASNLLSTLGLEAKK